MHDTVRLLLAMGVGILIESKPKRNKFFSLLNKAGESIADIAKGTVNDKTFANTPDDAVTDAEYK